MTEPHEAPAPPSDAERFRRTLVRVMSVQVVTLVLLGLMQWAFSR
jgi:hypothetical protein